MKERKKERAKERKNAQNKRNNATKRENINPSTGIRKRNFERIGMRNRKGYAQNQPKRSQYVGVMYYGVRYLALL